MVWWVPFINLMADSSETVHVIFKFPMLQPPSPLLEMASLRLPDSEEYDIDTRHRTNGNQGVPGTSSSSTTGTSSGGSASVLSGSGNKDLFAKTKNGLTDYISNSLIDLVTAPSPIGSTMEESSVGFLNASGTGNLSSDRIPDLLYRHTMAMTAVYCVAYLLVFIIGLIGNSFVIAVVYRSPRMRTVTNFFIVNLAVADILVIVFCLPATLMSNIFVRKLSKICLYIVFIVISKQEFSS